MVVSERHTPMSPKHLVFLVTVLCGTAWAAGPVRAQIGGGDLPDLSGLAGAIEKSTQAAPPGPPKPPTPGVVYHSGLSVPSVHPGETAKSIVRLMREPMEKKSGPNAAMKKLEDSMPMLLTQIEDYLPKQGLAKRDLGVAFGVFFVTNWETAKHQTLSDPTEIKLIKAVGETAAAKYKSKFATMTPAVKEKTYEQVLMTTILIKTLTDAFDKAGKPTEAESFRKAAGSIFTSLVGTAPEMLDISLDGKVSGPASDPPPTPTDPAPSETAPPAADPAPPATDASPLDAPPADKPAGPSGKAAPHGVAPSKIAGVYCRPAYGSGAGGGVSVSYEPVLALKDGTYCGGFEVPPPDLDAAASRRTHPSDWGRWRRAGGEIQTRDGSGHWGKSGWIGPLPPSGPGQTLSGRYTKISGGGNSALGGDITVAMQDSFLFSPDGRFRSGHTNSVTSSQVAGGASQAGSGTYAISRNAITLHYADGAVKRWSYAKTADGLVFLHGSAYVDDK